MKPDHHNTERMITMKDKTYRVLISVPINASSDKDALRQAYTLADSIRDGSCVIGHMERLFLSSGLDVVRVVDEDHDLARQALHPFTPLTPDTNRPTVKIEEKIMRIPAKKITIPQQAARGSERVRLLIIDCPFCGERHTHGGGTLAQPISYGSRGSHCLDINVRGDYEIVPPDEWREELARMAA